MSEDIKVDDNGHEPIQEQEVKARQLLAIAITEDGKVIVKGQFGREQKLCLTALGEAIKIVSNFEKPVIVKPDFVGGLRRFLPNKKN